MLEILFLIVDELYVAYCFKTTQTESKMVALAEVYAISYVESIESVAHCSTVIITSLHCSSE